MTYKGTVEERRAAKREYAAHYRAANREKVIEYQARWRAQEGVVNDFDVLDWRELLTEYDNTCAYCGTGDVPLEVEHKTPLSRGGDNSKANVVPACRRCNMRKGNKTLAEYMASRIVLTERGLI